MSVSQTADNPLIVTGKEDRLLAYRYPDLQYSPLGLFVINRLVKNRDVKGVITSKGNTTGTGKTWLTIQLARTFAQWGAYLFNRTYDWHAEKYAFMNVWDYIDMYSEARSGDVLITDELQTMVDKRRSLTHENVDFSHEWMRNRWKNVITLATAPSLHNLDKRIKENSDIWINITTQGHANVYFLTMHDFTELWIPKRFKRNGFRQSFLFLPPPENDPDYRYLHGLKKEASDRDRNEITKDDLNQTKKDILDDIICNTLSFMENGGELQTQKDISDKILGGIRSQQYVSQIKREKFADED